LHWSSRSAGVGQRVRALEVADLCAVEVAKVRKICMTNSPFDDLERLIWEKGFARRCRWSVRRA
jgi:hypothetical protein